MSFNPSSFTSTQNAGVKPKIVVGDAGYMTTAADGANWTTVAPSATPFTVTEGQSAVVVYHFVNPTTNALTELMDTATVNIKWAGASAADVSGQLQYLLYSPTTGWAANFQNVLPSGNVSFTDALTTDPTVGTGVSAIAFRLAVVKDTLAENGEHINFQLTQSSATKFTDSFYVEAKVDIVDAVNTVTNNSVVGVLSGSANADSFVVNPGSTVWNGVKAFQTIGASSGTEATFAVSPGTTLGAGDKIQVNMATDSLLSMVNFGSMTPVGITSEAGLINGLRALNQIDCNVGGLYMMQVTEDMNTALGAGNVNNITSTYIIFDSNGNGKLDTDGAGDVFVKLLGVTAASIQSTHFDLV